MHENKIDVEEKNDSQSGEIWMPIFSEDPSTNEYQMHLGNILETTGLLLQQVGQALVFVADSKMEGWKKRIRNEIQEFIRAKISDLKRVKKDDPNLKGIIKKLKSIERSAEYLLAQYGLTVGHLNLIERVIKKWAMQITKPCPFPCSLSIKNRSSIGSAIDDSYEILKSKANPLDLVANIKCPKGTDTEISPPTISEVPKKCVKIKEWKISSNPDRYSQWKKNSSSNSWVARLDVSKCRKGSLILVCATAKCKCGKDAEGKKKDPKCQDVECGSCILVFLK